RRADISSPTRLIGAHTPRAGQLSQYRGQLGRYLVALSTLLGEETAPARVDRGRSRRGSSSSAHVGQVPSQTVPQNTRATQEQPPTHPPRYALEGRQREGVQPP